MPLLYEVKNLPVCTNRRDNRQRGWCGPTALAAVTGMDYMQSIAALSFARGAPIQRSVYPEEIQKVLEERGYSVVRRFLNNHPTLAHFMDLMGGEGVRRVVLVTGHYVTVCGGFVCDSAYTGYRPIPFGMMMRGRRNRVLQYLEIVGYPVGTPTPCE